MSAAPVDGSSDTVKDGLSTVALSLAAMAARLVLARDKINPWMAAAYTSAACLTGYLVGRATVGRLDDGIRDCVIGVSAYAAPEILGYVMRVVKAKGEEAVKNAKGKTTKPRKRNRR